MSKHTRQHNMVDARKIMRIIIPSAWLMFILLGSTFLYIVSDEFQLGFFYFNLSIYICVGVCLLSYIFSYIIPANPRRAIGAKLMMFFAFLPILLICATFSFSYFFSIANSLSRFIAMALSIILIVGWSTYSVVRFRRRISERNFISKEFHIKDSEIVVQYSQKTSLESPRIKKDSFIGRFGDWLFPKLLVLTFIGYPLQHVFFLSGGMSAVLLLIAVLSLPVTVYIIGRLACAFYLWGYIALMLERKHGKPINFFENE